MPARAIRDRRRTTAVGRLAGPTDRPSCPRSGIPCPIARVADAVHDRAIASGLARGRRDRPSATAGGGGELVERVAGPDGELHRQATAPTAAAPAARPIRALGPRPARLEPRGDGLAVGRAAGQVESAQAAPPVLRTAVASLVGSAARRPSRPGGVAASSRPRSRLLGRLQPRVQVALQEGLAERRQQMAVDPVRVAEPDLDLGRVDIDVDLLGRDVQVQERHGHPADHQQAAIRFVQRVAQRAVADITAAQEQELPLGASTGSATGGRRSPRGASRSSRPSTQSSDSASSRPKKTAIRSRVPATGGRSWTTLPPERYVRWTSGCASAIRENISTTWPASVDVRLEERPAHRRCCRTGCGPRSPCRPDSRTP